MNTPRTNLVDVGNKESCVALKLHTYTVECRSNRKQYGMNYEIIPETIA